ncbi:MAG: insulinase family protein [Alphaproteobacteria bacterium]|nr:insulinase family protein [Alphaproteobacteria bacterium]MBU0858333.1 insulinase family protein [Alphaproteobacteria bacterium]
MTINITKLPNGLRVITDTVTAVDSVALGIWADVGTRHENLAHNGVAHMVEHMMFKGTPDRTALQIAEQVEDVGGQVNAYTSREMTAYHIHLLKDDLGLAVDILGDIVQNSHMPEDEVERERDVILQEIGMTVDTPDDLVFDQYQETAYPQQALGAPILGRSEIISTMQRDTLMNYVRQFYTPGRLVVAASGNVSHDEMVKRAEAAMGHMPPDQQDNILPAAYCGGEHREEKALEQAHIVMGFQGVSRSDKDYYTSVALATALGGGMSSRLFQEIREKRGLVYSVFSFHSAYQDDGQFVIYAGTGPDRLPELMPVMCDEIAKVTNDVMDEAELIRAKAQMRASLVMSRESMMTRANQNAKHLIHFGSAMDVQEKLDKINAVTLDDMRRMAQAIFSTKPTLAALGPLGQLEDYDVLGKRLAA